LEAQRGWAVAEPPTRRPSPHQPLIPIPPAQGYLAGDPDPDMDRKQQGLGAKNRVKKGKKLGGEEMCRSKGKVRNLCLRQGPCKAPFLTKMLTEIIIVNLCRSTLALEELRN